jgi:hypothetical protein
MSMYERGLGTTSAEALHWVALRSDPDLPAWAVSSGVDDEYVGRCYHRGSLLVGRVFAQGNRISIFVADEVTDKRYDSTGDHAVQHIEVLVNPDNRTQLAWLPQLFPGVLPPGAVQAGWYSAGCAPCFVGRPMRCERYVKVGWLTRTSSAVRFALCGGKWADSFLVLCALEGDSQVRV